MKDGLVQQVADPLTLYDKPSNRFVAGFIGTPPMNFFDGSILSNGSLVFDGEGGLQLPIPEGMHGALSAYAGKPITLGVRPAESYNEIVGVL